MISHLNLKLKSAKFFPFFLILLSIFLVTSGCTPKLTYPIKLSFSGKEGGKEVNLIEFSSSNKVYLQNEIDRETISKVVFDLESEVVKNKKNGLFVSQQTVTTKDGFYDLNRLGLPELGEKIDVEVNPRGYVLDVEGYPSDSIFYLPSLVFPDHAVNPGESWSESFTWRDYSVPFPIRTNIHFTLLRDEKYERNRVLRIRVSAASAFEGANESLLFENHVEGYILWDPKSSVIRYAETNMIDQLIVPEREFKSVTQSKFVTKLKKRS